MIFDKTKINFLPLKKRKSKISVSDVAFDSVTPASELDNRIKEIAKEIIKSRRNDRPVIIGFGAHLIRNGLGPILIKMVEENYITHLATNGAGSIHDWELAFQGETTEDVKEYLEGGQFGLWEETGKYLNLAIINGASEGLGYGESIGRMISLEKIAGEKLAHPFKRYSLQNSAFSNNILFTVHPCFGQDIIYAHPLSDGASIGKAAEIDFLKFVSSVSRLEGGCYLSIGSAIMSPMIFEKALSMSRNVAKQQEREIKDFMIVANDIQEGAWNWESDTEPPKKDPAYYLRFCKTFSRAGARNMQYIKMDNRDFVQQLYRCLHDEK